MKRQIELSNGAVYEIDAPEEATQEQLMTAIAEGLDPADRNVLKTKNDDFGAFLRGQALQPVEGEPDQARRKRLVGDIPLPGVGAGQGSARAGLQGATFGAGDEIVGAGAAGLDALTNRTPGKSLGELYSAYTARERDKIGSFRESNPALAIGSEVAGAIPAALLTGGGAVGSLGRRVLTGAGVGAAQGGVYGFNAGEGGIGNRLQSGAVTGALGGSIGAVAPAVAAGAKNIYNATLGAKRAANQAGMSRSTFEALSDIVEADRPGAPLTSNSLLAERGPTATAAADFLGQRPGPSQRIIKNAVGNRVASATGRVTSALDDTLGTPQGVRETGRQISRSTSRAREAAYKAAYDAPIDYADDAGREIEAVLGRIPKRVMNQAVQGANEAMQADGVVNRQIIANIADDGAVTFSKKPNVQQLDYIKRALGEIGASEVDNFGRPTGAGIRANNLARDLRGAIGNAVPEYNAAVKLGGDKIARDNGLRLGAKLLSGRTTREEVGEFVRGFGGQVPDDVLDAVKAGVRANIDDTMANVRRTMQDPNVDAREAAKAIKDLSSRANTEKLAAILGEEVDTLFKEIDQAANAFNLQAATIQNSKTAVRQMFGDRFNPPPGAVDSLLQGRPADATRQLVKGLTGRSDAAVRNSTDAQSAELARILMQRGQQGQQTLGRIQQGPGIAQNAEQIRTLVEQLMRKNAGATAPLQENLR